MRRNAVERARERPSGASARALRLLPASERPSRRCRCRRRRRAAAVPGSRSQDTWLAVRLMCACVASVCGGGGRARQRRRRRHAIITSAEGGSGGDGGGGRGGSSSPPPSPIQAGLSARGGGGSSSGAGDDDAKECNNLKSCCPSICSSVPYVLRTSPAAAPPFPCRSGGASWSAACTQESGGGAQLRHWTGEQVQRNTPAGRPHPAFAAIAVSSLVRSFPRAFFDHPHGACAAYICPSASGGDYQGPTDVAHDFPIYVVVLMRMLARH